MPAIFVEESSLVFNHILFITKYVYKLTDMSRIDGQG